jgi:hypothetical protein
MEKAYDSILKKHYTSKKAEKEDSSILEALEFAKKNRKTLNPKAKKSIYKSVMKRTIANEEKKEKLGKDKEYKEY